MPHDIQDEITQVSETTALTEIASLLKLPTADRNAIVTTLTELVEVHDDLRAFYDGLRPAVRAFAKLMEDKLAKNDHKGDWAHPSPNHLHYTFSPHDLLARLKEEVTELEQAIENGEGAVAIALEAADIGNFGLMVSDVVGGLSGDGSVIGGRKS